VGRTDFLLNFGLSVAVRRLPGGAGVVFMANTPGAIRRHYREVVKTQAPATRQERCFGGARLV
jgi:hypothetical protein